MEPNIPAIKKWIEALESGEYKQTKGKLKETHKRKFCCLGVACDLVKDDPELGFRWRDYKKLGILPLLISDYFRIGDDLENKCMSWNDDEGLSFEEIALKLREHFNLPKE